MHIKPKKSLGQNFLIDNNIQRKIIEACQLKLSDIVLEIGSGRAELTRLIAQNVGKIYALEIDKRLCDILEDTLKGHPNVTIINRDVLKLNFRKFFCSTLKRDGEKLKVIGNIPYYIATPIIEHLLKYKECIDSVFITVQKEFARRMAAKAGSKDYGSFSCFLQYYCEPRVLFIIKKTCFHPSPKVDSCFLQLKIRRGPPLQLENEKFFFKVIRAAFGKRRKILKNSLEGVIPPEKLNRFFSEFGFSPTIRPEQLSLKDFANLANI